MNIFATHKNPIKSAVYLFNDNSKRALKMIVESCQLLSNTLHYYNVKAPYKKTHFNHPCSVFVRKYKKAFTWLVSHCDTLIKLYNKKYNKNHKCDEVLDMICFEYSKIENEFENDFFDDFVNCARNKSLDLDFINIKDTHIAYRKYLEARKELSKKF